MAALSFYVYTISQWNRFATPSDLLTVRVTAVPPQVEYHRDLVKQWKVDPTLSHYEAMAPVTPLLPVPRGLLRWLPNFVRPNSQREADRRGPVRSRSVSRIVLSTAQPGWKREGSSRVIKSGGTTLAVGAAAAVTSSGASVPRVTRAASTATMRIGPSGSKAGAKVPIKLSTARDTVVASSGECSSHLFGPFRYHFDCRIDC
jgi:hypothetical protein